MSTSVVTLELAPPRPRRALWPRLASAELLKLRRRRGLVAITALLTIAPMIVGYSILTYLHATDPSAHAPAGGAA